MTLCKHFDNSKREPRPDTEKIPGYHACAYVILGQCLSNLPDKGKDVIMLIISPWAGRLEGTKNLKGDKFIAGQDIAI